MSRRFIVGVSAVNSNVLMAPRVLFAMAGDGLFWRGATEVSMEIRPLREVMKTMEAAHIVRALEACGGHRSQTADMLGISRKVLWEKMRDLGLSAPG